ncbi:MAG: hypothetical protein J7L53_03415 [Deltaproteobacteria bacterium]|nr:hypothetical protein [Deltaproteobacteria bacterium]
MSILSALNANSILLANASSNLANLNTKDYKSLRTTLIEGKGGDVAVSTQRLDTPGVPTDDGHEESNVDIPRELCDMIRAQRGYESALKAICAREEMLHSLTEMLKNR